MAIRLTIIVSVFLAFSWSCCKEQQKQGTCRPEWETEIPTGTAGEIYYEGLPNLPKSGDLLIAHTTIRDDGFLAEDNRLCAIDVKTGDIAWYFPADLEEKQYCSFNGKGYLYNNKLVFLYENNVSLFPRLVTATCLDVNNGDVFWEYEHASPSVPLVPAIGRDNVCFFVPDSSRVFKVDMDTDRITEFYRTSGKDVYINDIALCGNNLVVSCCCRTDEEYQLESSVVVLEAGTGQVRFSRILGRDSVPSHSIMEGDVLYSNVDTHLEAVDIIKGCILWERQDDWAYVLNDLIIYKDVLLKCAVNATVGYDKHTGKIRYDYQDYGSWYTTLHGKYAYMVNRQNKIDIIDVETGAIVDKIVCPYGKIGFFGSYPVFHDGKMYIMGENRLFRYPVYPWN